MSPIGTLTFGYPATAAERKYSLRVMITIHQISEPGGARRGPDQRIQTVSIHHPIDAFFAREASASDEESRYAFSVRWPFSCAFRKISWPKYDISFSRLRSLNSMMSASGGPEHLPQSGEIRIQVRLEIVEEDFELRFAELSQRLDLDWVHQGRAFLFHGTNCLIEEAANQFVAFCIAAAGAQLE